MKIALTFVNLKLEKNGKRAKLFKIATEIKISVKTRFFSFVISLQKTIEGAQKYSFLCLKMCPLMGVPANCLSTL